MRWMIAKNSPSDDKHVEPENLRYKLSEFFVHRRRTSEKRCIGYKNSGGREDENVGMPWFNGNLILGERICVK